MLTTVMLLMIFLFIFAVADDIMNGEETDFNGGMYMVKNGVAYFVKNPRRLSDLKALHALDRESEYEIVCTYEPDVEDYENFTYDLLADREFIEQLSDQVRPGTPYQCILIKNPDGEDGILVNPAFKSFVGFAAYYPGEIA